MLGSLWRVSFLAVGAAACSSSAGTGTSAPVTTAAAWTLTHLGPGRCVAVSAAGQLLGVDADNSSFVSDLAGKRTPLGLFTDGALAIGAALDDRGTVVGYSDKDGVRTAIVHGAGGWTAVAGAPDGWSAAFAIDENGRIAGAGGATGDTAMHGFVSGGALPLPAGAPSAVYLAASGRVAGIVQVAGGATHAFVAAGATLTDLGTLGGDASAPLGMNARGDVVGAAETAAGEKHAFVAPAGGALVDLGLPDGALASEARGIDAAQHVVGNLAQPAGRTRAVELLRGKPPVDFSPAGAPYRSTHVLGLSANGVAAGWGTLADGTTRCLVWKEGP